MASVRTLSERADIDPFDVGTRRHDGTHAAVGQSHDAAHHAALGRRESPRRLGVRDHALDLVLGDALLLLARESRTDAAGRSTTSRAGRRSASPRRPSPRSGRATTTAMASGARSAICLGTSSPTTTDRKVTIATTMPKPAGSATGREHAVRDQDLVERRADRRAREGAGQNADQGDADLNGREEPAGIVEQRKGGAGARAAPSAKALRRPRREEITANSEKRKQGVEEDQDHRQDDIDHPSH